MSDELRVVMVTTNILDDIEEGLDLSAEPTVILQGGMEAVKAAAKLFGEPVTIAGISADLADALAAALRGAIGALEFSRDYHADLGNEDQAFAQDKLDDANAALAAWEARK